MAYKNYDTKRNQRRIKGQRKWFEFFRNTGIYRGDNFSDLGNGIGECNA